MAGAEKGCGDGRGGEANPPLPPRRGVDGRTTTFGKEKDEGAEEEREDGDSSNDEGLGLPLPQRQGVEGGAKQQERTDCENANAYEGEEAVPPLPPRRDGIQVMAKEKKDDEFAEETMAPEWMSKAK